jgi:hypothetical protein
MTAENWALFFHLLGAFLLTRIGALLVVLGSALVLAFGLDYASGPLAVAIVVPMVFRPRGPGG